MKNPKRRPKKKVEPPYDMQLPMRWVILMGQAYVSLPHSYKVQSPHRTSGTCRHSNNSKHRPIPFHHQGSGSN